MGTATRHGLRSRLPAPRGATVSAQAPQIDRVLALAADLFGVAAAAVVLATPHGLRVEAIAGEGSRRPEVIASAGQLFEALAASTSGAGDVEAPTGVLENVTLDRGYAAAAPILSAEGRCLGALCLVDRDRRTLLSALQRRLFAEFGGLAASSLRERPPSADPAARSLQSAEKLQRLADDDADAIALFDVEGRCLVRNRRFDGLLGPRPGARPPVIPAAAGCEAAWLSGRIARDLEPVGIYRAALADGTWLCVEERRTRDGHSLIGRIEHRGLIGGQPETQLLFERCPFAMFVVDRDTRAVLVANAAALTLYGWDRDGLHRVDLASVGPVEADPAAAPHLDSIQDWTHRTRDGRPIVVSGRSIDLVHRGRPAMLVTVTGRVSDLAADGGRARAA